jgi:hypothetical protein
LSNTNITYLVGGGCGLIALIAFITLFVVPALQSHRRAWERVAVVVLSAYVLAAFAGIGLLLGALLVFEWPSVF